MGASNSVIECALMGIQQTHKPKKASRWKKILKHSRRGSNAPRLQSLIQLSLRFFAALLGLGLLSYLVFRTGPEIVWNQLQAVGWGFVLVLLLGGLSQLAKTCAWRKAFTCFDARHARGSLLPMELSLAVETALGRLNDDQREAVLLKVYQGFKFEEMADILECPVSTAKSRLYTALDLLKTTLGPSLSLSKVRGES